jgi:hypothetical protein
VNWTSRLPSNVFQLSSESKNIIARTYSRWQMRTCDSRWLYHLTFKLDAGHIKIQRLFRMPYFDGEWPALESSANGNGIADCSGTG